METVFFNLSTFGSRLNLGKQSQTLTLVVRILSPHFHRKRALFFLFQVPFRRILEEVFDLFFFEEFAAVGCAASEKVEFGERLDLRDFHGVLEPVSKIPDARRHRTQN